MTLSTPNGNQLRISDADGGISLSDENGNEREAFFLGGIASGSEPRRYPDGFGRLLLPGSQIGIDLSWRNLGGIDLSLYRVDLTRDVDPAASKRPMRILLAPV